MNLEDYNTKWTQWWTQLGGHMWSLKRKRIFEMTIFSDSQLLTAWDDSNVLQQWKLSGVESLLRSVSAVVREHSVAGFSSTRTMVDVNLHLCPSSQSTRCKSMRAHVFEAKWPQCIFIHGAMFFYFCNYGVHLLIQFPSISWLQQLETDMDLCVCIVLSSKCLDKSINILSICKHSWLNKFVLWDVTFKNIFLLMKWP